MMDYIFAFIFGGVICVIGQILLETTKLTAPRILVIFVVSGVVLEAFHLYEPLVQLAGTGVRVPLPGFGYALAKGAIEGAGKGILEALTGAVKSTAAGVTVAIVWGYVIAVIFSPKSIR